MNKNAFAKKERNWDQMKETNKEEKNKMKHIMQDTKVMTKALIHNGLIGIVYGFIMLCVAIIAINMSMMLIGYVVGSQGTVALNTIADMLSIYMSLIMVGGLVLFFTFKLENGLIAAAKKRMWSVVDGEIVKNKMK